MLVVGLYSSCIPLLSWMPSNSTSCSGSLPSLRIARRGDLEGRRMPSRNLVPAIGALLLFTSGPPRPTVAGVYEKNRGAGTKLELTRDIGGTIDLMGSLAEVLGPPVADGDLAACLTVTTPPPAVAIPAGIASGGLLFSTPAPRIGKVCWPSEDPNIGAVPLAEAALDKKPPLFDMGGGAPTLRCPVVLQSRVADK
mmetsp:Transcript_6262/g.14984  ORF Transcript_6262/g.14984 Transcript_6262/m.14984 type:complete len:196 (+) Transcript_6262:399-986(+)